jgi:membrane-associated phospholipid phosphatase
MGIALMSTGEHYFFDVLLGWLYAGAVMVGWARWERRRAGAAEPQDLEPARAQQAATS